jgi:membrane-associated phospholipid phosphatase
LRLNPNIGKVTIKMLFIGKATKMMVSEAKIWNRTHRGSLLLLGMYLPLAIFTVLAFYVSHQGQGFWWDIPILQAVHATARPVWDRLAQTLSPLGVFWGVFPISVAIGVKLLYRHQWRSLWYLCISLLGNGAINRGAKLLFHRERPHIWEVIDPELDYAFPSGHAMSSMAFALVLVVLVWDKPWRWLVGILAGLFVLAIAWTRLYLGVHYPSDILGGWLLALGWTMGATLLIRPQQAFGDTSTKAQSD